MKEYTVQVSAAAKNDLRISYLWGVENWGEDNARSWLREIEAKIFKRLSVMPYAFPVAPESKEYKREIRQFLFGRYRILFTVKEPKVLVLRVRGPFTE